MQQSFLLTFQSKEWIKISTCAGDWTFLISKSWLWGKPKNPLTVLKADLWGDFIISVLTALRKSLGKPIRELYKIIFWQVALVLDCGKPDRTLIFFLLIPSQFCSQSSCQWRYQQPFLSTVWCFSRLPYFSPLLNMETPETERHTLPSSGQIVQQYGILWKKDLKTECSRYSQKSGLIANLGGEGNGNPLQYSCLENPVDGGAWWAAVRRATGSQTQLKQLSMHACIASL